MSVFFFLSNIYICNVLLELLILYFVILFYFCFLLFLSIGTPFMQRIHELWFVFPFLCSTVNELLVVAISCYRYFFFLLVVVRSQGREGQG